jgi:hypothetical protein
VQSRLGILRGYFAQGVLCCAVAWSFIGRQCWIRPVYGADACIKAVGSHVVTEQVFGMQEGQLLGTSYGVNLADQQEDHQQFIERLCVMGLRD